MKEIYRCPYEAYPFLSDPSDILSCDFEIMTDRMSSMVGLIAAKCPERREELLRVDELIYHFNPTLRTFLSIEDEEFEWLMNAIESMEKELGDKSKFVLPAGSERACLAHVLRTDGKALVRMLYRIRERGVEFSDKVIDFGTLISGYFYMLALWLNKADGVEEISFESRNYKG